MRHALLLGCAAAVALLVLVKHSTYPAAWSGSEGCSPDAPFVTHELYAARRGAAGSGVRCVRQASAAEAQGGQANASSGAPPLDPGVRTVDLSLAYRLLPLTNLSALTTAALLDAAQSNASAHGRRLVRLHQDLYCRWAGLRCQGCPAGPACGTDAWEWCGAAASLAAGWHRRLALSTATHGVQLPMPASAVSHAL